MKPVDERLLHFRRHPRGNQAALRIEHSGGGHFILLRQGEEPGPGRDVLLLLPKPPRKLAEQVAILSLTQRQPRTNFNLELARIGVFLPEQIASFYNILREGIRETAEQWSASSRLDLVFHSYPRLGEGDVDSLLQANWQDYDGIITSPGDTASLRSIFRKEDGLPPVVFVGSDAPRLHRLASIAVDAVISGSIAAELLGGMIPRSAPVAVITGDLRVQDHADKLRGFAGSLATLSHHLSLLPPIEAHDDASTAYTRAAALFREQPELAGLYVNTANSIPVLEAAEKSNRLGKLKIITTDFFPELIPMIESNMVLASLYQRPYSQGRMAVETLIRYFSRSEVPTEQQTRLAPHIILRSNIEIFVRLMQRDDVSA